VKIFFTDNSVEESSELILSDAVSKMIFDRAARIDRIEVSVSK
jgi:hypothetical protein